MNKTKMINKLREIVHENHQGSVLVQAVTQKSGIEEAVRRIMGENDTQIRVLGTMSEAYSSKNVLYIINICPRGPEYFPDVLKDREEVVSVTVTLNDAILLVPISFLTNEFKLNPPFEPIKQDTIRLLISQSGDRGGDLKPCNDASSTCIGVAVYGRGSLESRKGDLFPVSRASKLEGVKLSNGFTLYIPDRKTSKKSALIQFKSETIEIDGRCFSRNYVNDDDWREILSGKRNSDEVRDCYVLVFGPDFPVFLDTTLSVVRDEINANRLKGLLSAIVQKFSITSGK